MQNINSLLTLTKTNFSNEAIKVKSDDNIIKSGSPGSPSFIDLLFADQMETVNSNVFEESFSSQTSHDLPGVAESLKGDVGLQENDDSENQDFSENKQKLIDYSNNDQQDNLDIKHEDTDLFVSQDSDPDPVVEKDDGSKNKNEENSVVTVISDKELKTDSIQEDHDLKSHQDMSKAESAINSRHEKASADVDIEDKENRDIKSEIITSLKKLLSQEDIKLENPELFVLLKKVLSVVQGIEMSNKKSDVIKNLRELISLNSEQGKSINTKTIKGLMKLLSRSDNSHRDKELIAKLNTILSVIEKSGVKADAIRDLRELLPHDGNVPKDQELIAKLNTILSVIEGKEGKGVKADIDTKLQKLLSQEGIENKNKKLLAILEKTITELKNHEKNIKSVKSGKGDTEKNIIKVVVERLDEYINEKVINKDKNVEKRNVVSDKLSNDLNNVKISDKGKESTDRSSKSRKDVSLENETIVEPRFSKEGNNVDTSNSDRDIKVEQKVAFSQGIKNGLTDQHQSKNKFAQQGKNGKSENSKLQRSEAEPQIVSDKTQNIFKSETTSQVNKTTPPARSISQSQLGEMIIRGARQFQKGGNSEIHLTIKKPDLGNVKISFVENGKGKLEVLVIAERPETSEIIKQNSAEIRQLLIQEGMDISKFDVFDQYNRNKKFLAQGNGSQKNYRGNRSLNDDESTGSNELLIEDDDLSIQDVGTVSSNEQVNVFV